MVFFSKSSAFDSFWKYKREYILTMMFVCKRKTTSFYVDILKLDILIVWMFQLLSMVKSSVILFFNWRDLILFQLSLVNINYFQNLMIVKLMNHLIRVSNCKLMDWCVDKEALENFLIPALLKVKCQHEILLSN